MTKWSLALTLGMCTERRTTMASSAVALSMPMTHRHPILGAARYPRRAASTTPTGSPLWERMTRICVGQISVDLMLRWLRWS